MYTIVEWIGSDPREVSAVPSNWLTSGKDWSYWPSSAEAAAFKQRWKPKSSWQKYAVREIGTAGMKLLLRICIARY